MQNEGFPFNAICVGIHSSTSKCHANQVDVTTVVDGAMRKILGGGVKTDKITKDFQADQIDNIQGGGYWNQVIVASGTCVTRLRI
jgi:hypothetical protein